MPALGSDPRWVLSIGLLVRAAEACKTRDYKGFLDGYREASALSPENPNLLYRVARGYALVGNADAAVEILGRLAAMHLVYPIADHPDLVSRRDHPGFRADASAYGIDGLIDHRGTLIALQNGVSPRRPAVIARMRLSR